MLMQSDIRMVVETQLRGHIQVQTPSLRNALHLYDECFRQSVCVCISVFVLLVLGEVDFSGFILTSSGSELALNQHDAQFLFHSIEREPTRR